LHEHGIPAKTVNYIDNIIFDFDAGFGEELLKQKIKKCILNSYFAKQLSLVMEL
jgi:hypothetical protein